MQFDSFLIFSPKENARTEAAEDEIQIWAERRGIEVQVVKKGGRFNPADIIEGDGGNHLVLTLGGDGTFLHAADLVAPLDLPLLGINFGSLGFLAALSGNEISEGLNNLSEDRFQERELIRLSCGVPSCPEDEDFTALNEFVVCRKEITGFAELKVFLDSELISTYSGDGVIISTPTGSTAYSLASGGPLLAPGTKAFAITPLNIHSLGPRPVVCPEKSSVTVKNSTPVSLLADGEKLCDLDPGSEIQLKKASKSTRVVLPEHSRGYFEVVRSKLSWGR
mgnify:CR=1 FL=1